MATYGEVRAFALGSSPTSRRHHGPSRIGLSSSRTHCPSRKEVRAPSIVPIVSRELSQSIMAINSGIVRGSPNSDSSQHSSSRIRDSPALSPSSSRVISSIIRNMASIAASRSSSANRWQQMHAASMALCHRAMTLGYQPIPMAARDLPKKLAGIGHLVLIQRSGANPLYGKRSNSRFLERGAPDVDPRDFHLSSMVRSRS